MSFKKSSSTVPGRKAPAPVPTPDKGKAALNFASRFAATEGKRKAKAKLKSQFGMSKKEGTGKSSSAENDEK